MVVTDHGLKRTKQRLHVSKEYAYKIINKAYKYGIHQKNVKNKSIKKYLDDTVHNNCFGVMYCMHLFIFSKDSNSLITVLKIPELYIDILYSGVQNNIRRNNKNEKRKHNKIKRTS